MKIFNKALVAGACGATLVAGGVLSAPIAGAESSTLSSDSLGAQCESVTSDATLELDEDGAAGDVKERTGGVPEEKGLVRADGWVDAGKVYTRFGFATGTELNNVTLTLKLDDNLAVEGDASIETPGAANVDEDFPEALDGGLEVIDGSFDADENTATYTIDKVNADSSVSFTFGAEPEEGVTEFVNSITVEADNLDEAGFCGEGQGLIGSIDDALGSLPGGSLGNGSVANLLGSIGSSSADDGDDTAPEAV